MDNAEVKAPPAIQPEATKAGPGRLALSNFVLTKSQEEAAAPAINFEDEGADLYQPPVLPRSDENATCPEGTRTVSGD